MKRGVETAGTDDPATIDAASRAAQLWLAQLFASSEANDDAGQRHALAGGFIWGLCKALDLQHRTPDMVAYVYALLTHEGARALAVSRSMLSSRADPVLKPIFQRGVERAHQLISDLSHAALTPLGAGKATQ